MLQIKITIKTIIIAILLNVVGMMNSNAQTIVNADFESGNTGFLSDYTYVNPQYNGQNVGIENGKYTIDNTSSGHGLGSIGWPTILGYGGSGKYMLVNGFGGNTNPTKAVWKQTVTVTPNTDYIFSCQVVNLAQSVFGYSPIPAILRLKINGSTVGGDYTVAQNNTWHEWSVSWHNGNATQAEIAIYDVYTGDSGLGDDFGLDHLSLTPQATYSVNAVDDDVPLCVEYYQTYQIDVLANDIIIPSGQMSEATVQVIQAPAYGNASWNSNTHKINYTFMDQSYYGGLDQFKYRVTIPHGESSDAWVYVNTGRVPNVGWIDTPGPICAGGSLDISVPSVEPDQGSGQWVCSQTQNGTFSPFDANNVPLSMNGWYVKYKATNDCGDGYSNAVQIHVYDEPTISTPATPQAICAGNSFNLTTPTIQNNGSTVTNQGWQIAAQQNGSYSSFNNSNVPYTYNGYWIRYFAENECGMTYSAAVQITVNDVPEVGNIVAPSTIYAGESFELTTPQIDWRNIYFGTGCWEIAPASTGPFVTLININIPFSYNGYYIRYKAVNGCGTAYSSNIVQVSVNNNEQAYYVITATANPEEGGTICFEDMNSNNNYVRISNLDQLIAGSQVIFAACFNENTDSYYAMSNTSSGKPTGVLFTSTTADENEVLPASIVDEESSYYWIVGVTDNGYTFTNAAGELIGYTSSTNFATGGDNTEWTIEFGTAGDEAMVPNYAGFLISNVNNPVRHFALNSNHNFGSYHTNYLINSGYNFYLDLFVKTEGGEPPVLPTPTVATPTFTPEAGTYFEEQSVSISCATDSATIYYSTVSENGPWTEYTEAITVEETMTIWAYAEKEGYNDSPVASATYIIQLGVITIFNQDWEGEMNGWTFVDVEGEMSWTVASYQGNHYAYANGYNHGANTDWCISPAFNLNAISNPVLSFRTAKNYTGPDLEVFLSSDYDGTNPATATWLPLTCNLSQGSWNWVESGVISLGNFSGNNCYIAFKYTCEENSAAGWEVDDILLIDDVISGNRNRSCKSFLYGTTATLNATANVGYQFVNWTEDGEIVSTESSYSFTVTGDRNLVANFIPYSHHWTAESYTNSMFILGVVKIDSVEQASSAIELGAFCNGECRGTVFPFEEDSRWLYFMNIVGNSGDEITFRLYDHALQQELDLYCYNVLPFEESAFIGLDNPYELQFASTFTISAEVNPVEGGTVIGTGDYAPGTSATLVATPNEGYAFNCWTLDGEVVSTEPSYTFTVTESMNFTANFDVLQLQQLTSGWNWFSTYLEITLDDLKAALLAAFPNVGANALVIKSNSNGNTAWNPIAHRWIGGLTTMDLSQMYMVKVPANAVITLQGVPINPADHPVTIVNGNNWIAFPFRENMSVNNAFAGFPVNGDIIKSNGDGAAAFYGVMWIGGLNTLNPGKGYIYKSNAQESRTFVFGTNAAK